MLSLSLALILFGGNGGCKTYNVPDTDRGYVTAQKLISKGWYGIPGDGAERLYSPRCKRFY